MTDICRRSIAELQSRYELEPDLADVYVEGQFDRELFSNVESLKKEGFAFYEIDTVDVPKDILNKHGFTSGNKQRVFALAKELETSLSSLNPTFLIDKDMDHWLGGLQDVTRLRWSTYCSTELHFLTQEHVHTILAIVANIKFASFEALYDSFAVVLRHIYSIRLTACQAEGGMTWVKLKKYLRREGDCIQFDLKGYIRALLLANKMSGHEDEFVERVQDWQRKLSGDIRQCVRGHDFLHLLAWSISEFCGLKDFASEAAIQRLFILIARDTDALAGEIR